MWLCLFRFSFQILEHFQTTLSQYCKMTSMGSIVVKLATCLLIASALHMTLNANANSLHSSEVDNSIDDDAFTRSSSSDENLERRLQLHRLKVSLALSCCRAIMSRLFA